MAHEVRDEWFTKSEALFFALKDQFVPDGSWVFDVSSPDVEYTDLIDRGGSAAFALRRIQALRYLLARELSEHTDRLIVGYAADLVEFLRGVLNENLLTDPRYEPVVKRGLVATTFLLANATEALTREIPR